VKGGNRRLFFYFNGPSGHQMKGIDPVQAIIADVYLFYQACFTESISNHIAFFDFL
jgi:hypothetical protein